MSKKLIMTILLANICLSGLCQGFLRYENFSSSSLKDKDGNLYGSGNLQRFSGRYNDPLSKKLNERNQPTTWNLTLSASYSLLHNQKEAEDLNPDKILNTSITVSHVRPLSERWSLIASLGGGIYAIPNEVNWHSLLANGAFFFTYRLQDNLTIGIGGGLTNSYGAPIVMPMGISTSTRMANTMSLSTLQMPPRYKLLHKPLKRCK